MKTNDILSKLRSGAASFGAAVAPKSAQRRSKAPAAPPSRRDMAYMGWTAAIFLCVALSVFSFFFASCSKAEAVPDSSVPPISSPADSPDASPYSSPTTAPVTPAL